MNITTGMRNALLCVACTLLLAVSGCCGMHKCSSCAGCGGKSECGMHKDRETCGEHAADAGAKEGEGQCPHMKK